MKTLKGWITTTCLVTTLMLSTMTANAGVIIGGVAHTEEPCSTTTSKEGKIDYGVIIGGLTGVIIGGLTGVIIGGLTVDVPTQDCGVIIGG